MPLGEKLPSMLVIQGQNSLLKGLARSCKQVAGDLPSLETCFSDIFVTVSSPLPHPVLFPLN